MGAEGSRPRLLPPALASLSSQLRWTALSGLFALISGVLTYRFMERHLPLSVVDEFQYIDAVNKAQRWDVVFTGDKTDQYARVLAACRGVGYGDPS